MEKVVFVCKCKHCVNRVEKKDEKWGIRVSCEYAPGIEFLKDYCEKPLNELCGHFKSESVFSKESK